VTDEPSDHIPADWARPTPARVEKAAAFAMLALASDSPWPVQDRLRSYYRRDGNYAGASFAEMQPNPVRDVVAADLHAVTLLAVMVKPRATRRLLDDCGHRSEVLTALAEVDELGVTSLPDAGHDVLVAMDRLFRAVRSACQDPDAGASNPWVTASKLCARKRPGLFPVRDTTVCTALGLIGAGMPQGDWQLDWQVYQQLLEHPGVWRGLDAAIGYVSSLPRPEFAGDAHPLRIFDAALWTYESQRLRQLRQQANAARKVRRPAPVRTGQQES